MEFVAEGQAAAGAGGAGWTASVESLPLDPTHTFERFVIGSGNRLAHSAALAVAELPGEAYNPLFLHGPPGLGKTHLLGAVVHYLRRRRPELTVHYTTAERFTTEFVGALRKDGPERFKQRYRKLDALLIDDVQALEGKEHTQEEFVHTFNALHAAGKQIVLSSDRPPEALARLAERLRDRFGWGLCVELGSPDFRTRTALLWRMAVEGAAGAPRPRRAEGDRQPGGWKRPAPPGSDDPRGRRLLDAQQAGDPGPRSPGTRSVATAAAWPLRGCRPRSRLPQRQRDPGGRLLRARRLPAGSPVAQAHRAGLTSTALAMYLARDLTSLSLAQIAREFDRDHSTVLHAVRIVSSRLDPDSETSAVLHRARQLLATPTDATVTEPGSLHQPPTLHISHPPTHRAPSRDELDFSTAIHRSQYI